MTIIVGTRINCVLRHAGRGIVYAIHGEQRPDTVSIAGGVFHRGGNATFDLVFDNGHTSLKLPECIIRGVQWSILPGIATDKEIAEALAYAAHVAANARKAAEDAVLRFAVAVQRLRADPTLKNLLQGEELRSGKLAVKNIRTELKAAFPGVRFSVRNRDHGSIDITWTDGPTEGRVKEVTDKYEAGVTDMDDGGEYCPSPWIHVFGGADFVFTSRTHSNPHIARAIDALFASHDGLDGIAKPTPETAFGSFVAVPGEQWDLGILIRLQAADMEGGEGARDDRQRDEGD